MSPLPLVIELEEPAMLTPIPAALEAPEAAPAMEIFPLPVDVETRAVPVRVAP